MSKVDASVRKTRTGAQAAERDQKSIERVAVLAEQRAQRARLALKKAKEEAKLARKAARKARKAADAASKAFAKATARVTRAEAGGANTKKAARKKVAPRHFARPAAAWEPPSESDTSVFS